MKPRETVVIVSGLCSRNKQGFGIRFEENGRGKWIADWAFPIKATVAKREGYDQSTIAGTFLFAPEFPGCPHCKSLSFVKCNCQVLSCIPKESNYVRCPSCGLSGSVKGSADSLSAGQDS